MNTLRIARRLVSAAVLSFMLFVTAGCISFGISGDVGGFFGGSIGSTLNGLTSKNWFGYTNYFVGTGSLSGLSPISYFHDVARYSMEDGEPPEQFTPEQQYYVGRGVSASLVNGFRIANVEDAKTRAQLKYLNQMAGFIKVSNPDGASLWAGVKVGILDAPEVAAFATPGGYIWITRGALSMVQTEEELAALMCHELGHIAHEHAIRNYAERKTIKPNPFVRAAANRLSAVNRNFGNYIGEMAEDIAKNSYSKDQEYQADEWGMVTLQLAGYSHTAMYRLLERVEAWEKKNPQQGQYLQGHPPVKDRIERLKDYVDDHQDAFKLEVKAENTKRQNLRFQATIR